MTTTTALDALADAVVARRTADDAASIARAALDQMIRAEVANGRSVADIVRVTGLTRARIYQIRDGR